MTLRRSPLKRSAPLSRSSSLSRTGRLRPRSAKRAKWQREERIPFVEQILAERPWCEIAWDEGCTGRATDVDEIRLRSAGGSATDPANTQTACRHCHRLTHRGPEEAERRGFYIRGRGAA
jgi:hypothetical protein